MLDDPQNKLQFKRIILKLSGEVLGGKNHLGIETDALDHLVTEIKSAYDLGVSVGVVIGGGNFFRGIHSDSINIDPLTGDYIGMLATVMNAIVLHKHLEMRHIPVQLVSALEIPKICDSFTPRLVQKYLDQGDVVIFCAGTGHPTFTTDSAAALRAIECNADILLKATKVDGVYSSDPEKDSSATMFSDVSYIDVLQKRLHVMDMAAISICMEHNLPIRVYNLTTKGNLAKILTGESLGTLVTGS